MQDEQSKRGFVWSQRPLSDWGSFWTVDIEFRVWGRGLTLFGDGLALWLTKEPYSPGTGAHTCSPAGSA